MCRVTEKEIYAALCKRHTPEKQSLLAAGRVAIAGLGGLGSHVAFSLARIGVGSLHLVDFDRVDPMNLHRQQYLLEHIGMYKTEALKAQLVRINPCLQIRTSRIRVTVENCRELFEHDDIVCEAFDLPEEKAKLAGVILEQCPDKKLVAASGMAGYGNSNAIKTRRITGQFYLCGDGESELSKEHCLTAPRVSLCAAHQANMVVSLLLGKEDISNEQKK